MDNKTKIPDELWEDLNEELQESLNAMAVSGFDLSELVDMNVFAANDLDELTLEAMAQKTVNELTPEQARILDKVTNEVLRLEPQDPDRLRLLQACFAECATNDESPAEMLGISEKAIELYWTIVATEAARAEADGQLEGLDPKRAWTYGFLMGACVGTKYGALRDA